MTHLFSVRTTVSLLWAAAITVALPCIKPTLAGATPGRTSIRTRNSVLFKGGSRKSRDRAGSPPIALRETDFNSSTTILDDVCAAVSSLLTLDVAVAFASVLPTKPLAGQLVAVVQLTVQIHCRPDVLSWTKCLNISTTIALLPAATIAPATLARGLHCKAFTTTLARGCKQGCW